MSTRTSAIQPVCGPGGRRGWLKSSARKQPNALIEAVTGNRVGLIGESADVLYHLLVTWVDAGIRPEEVWQELQQRERVRYLTEGSDIRLKRLGGVQIGRSKIP
jgi:phosphoribosyl-ATP pyrophosphohydrolase